MKKILIQVFKLLNDGAYYADKNEPKQPQVCINNFAISQLIQVLRFLSENIKILGGLGNPQLTIFFKNILHMVFL